MNQLQSNYWITSLPFFMFAKSQFLRPITNFKWQKSAVEYQFLFAFLTKRSCRVRKFSISDIVW